MTGTVRLTRIIDDADLERIIDDNPGWKIERASDGSINMSPSAARYGPCVAELVGQLRDWNARSGRPGIVFGSVTGFTMPDGVATKAPDASWISRERAAAVPDVDKDTFAPIVPDVCVEVASKTDSWSITRKKVEGYRTDGARYAVALDPRTREVYELGEPPPGLHFDFDAVFDAAWR
ncbi:MAG: Uma2 family endonuclease [Candidatus Eremiobacteraeota bacterium]|nr:Uma2 family endonuclease [Candidatus Eremiobacteraeota bacterium]MBC5804518.1 Uma2 family endonuclease [Candidatus Eremiobacteraeota bacterium]MBC5825107.1 Uma2 family endonuclease [Candidatus Eremiobacteraeota bacterium]